MKNACHLLFLLFTVFIWQAHAQTSPSPAGSKMRGMTINADESDRDTESDTLDLRGHVQVIFKDEHLSCDHARVNFRSKTIDAIGNVLIVGPKSTTGGSRVYLDYESNTGVIYTGYVQAGNVYFEGQLITRTGESDYVADNAKFTTCTNCPESWSFSGQRIRAELGGYAYIKNSFLKIGGVPFFWLPYLIVPLKSDRQTGLLTPEFEQSESGGLTLSESFFWAMSRSTDTTWTIKNYELRGLKTLVNGRYALADKSYGELDVASIRDRVFASDDRLNTFRHKGDKNQTVDRWFLKYDHYFELPDGYTHRLQLNNASDLQYPKDFPLETRNHGDSAMENRMSLSKNTRDQHYSLDTSYYVNLLKSDPLAGNNDAVHRLPELRFSQAMSPLGESGLLYTADVDYVNFARSGSAYDDMNKAYNAGFPGQRTLLTDGTNCQDPAFANTPHCLDIRNGTVDGSRDTKCTSETWYNDPRCHAVTDGHFDPDKDLIRTGQRLDFNGTLYRPFQLANSLDILPKLTYRETQYQFGVGEDPSNTRRYVRAEVSARSVFSRIYGTSGPGRFDRFKHEIQPDVTFTTIPYLNQPKHPFFGNQDETPFFSQQNISDADLNGPYGIQFDYNDRLYDRKLMTFGLTNKLTQKIWSQGSPQYMQIATWRLAQSYDLYQAESNIEKKQPFSDVLSDLRVNLDRLQIYQRANYYPYQQVTNTSTRVRLLNEIGDYAEVGHLLLYDISPGQEAKKRNEDYTLSIRKNLSFVEFLGRVTYDVNPPAGKEDVRFKSYGYGAQVRLPGDCWYFTVTQYRITGGDNNSRVSFDFIWDGQKKPTLPAGLLDSFGF